MLDQSEIDSLLDSATNLAAEAGAQVGTSTGANPKVEVETKELSRILHMRFPVVVVLAERRMPLKNILSWDLGSIIEFDQMADSELGLSVGNRPVGTGHAVKVGEYFGLRVTHAKPLDERIRALGG